MRKEFGKTNDFNLSFTSEKSEMHIFIYFIFPSFSSFSSFSSILYFLSFTSIFPLILLFSSALKSTEKGNIGRSSLGIKKIKYKYPFLTSRVKNVHLFVYSHIPLSLMSGMYINLSNCTSNYRKVALICLYAHPKLRIVEHGF